MKALSSDSTDRRLGELTVIDTADTTRRAPSVPAPKGTAPNATAPDVACAPGPDVARRPGPAIACTATGLPDGLTLSADGVITGTVGGLGTHTVTITAPDARGEARTATFDWIVL